MGDLDARFGGSVGKQVCNQRGHMWNCLIDSTVLHSFEVRDATWSLPQLITSSSYYTLVSLKYTCLISVESNSFTLFILHTRSNTSHNFFSVGIGPFLYMSYKTLFTLMHVVSLSVSLSTKVEVIA